MPARHQIACQKAVRSRRRHGGDCSRPHNQRIELRGYMACLRAICVYSYHVIDFLNVCERHSKGFLVPVKGHSRVVDRLS